MSKLNLQRRERIVLYVGGAAIVLVLLQYFAQAPLAAYGSAARAAEIARSNYEAARFHRDDVVAHRNATEALQTFVRQNKSSGLITALDQVVRQTGLSGSQRANIQSASSFADTAAFEQVRVTLTGVSTDELVEFLHRLYSSGTLVAAQSGTIEPDANGQGLKCTLVLLSPRV